MELTYLTGLMEQTHGYSRAIEVKAPPGGRTIFIGGTTALFDESGAMYEKDVAVQFRAVLAKVDRVLREVDATLANIVSLTIYITEEDVADIVADIMREFWPDEKFPAGAMIGVSHLAVPPLCVEVQGIAIVPA